MNMASPHATPAEKLKYLKEVNRMAHMKPSQQQRPAFLNLPGEIRKIIYGHVFTERCYFVEEDTRCMERAMTYKVPGWGTWVELRPVGLVGVCQQIHREACSVLYGKSTFAFEDPQSLLFFLDNLTPVAAESLTHLAVKYHQIKSDCTGNAKMEDGPWEDLLHRLSTRHTTLTRLSLELTLEQRPNPRLLRGKGNELTQAFKASGILIALDLRNNWVRLRRQGKGSVMALEFSKLEGQVDRYIWD